MKKPRQPGRAMRAAVARGTRYGRLTGSRAAFPKSWDPPFLPMPATAQVPEPNPEMRKQDLAFVLCSDRGFFIGMMDEAERLGLTGPSALGDDLYRDPAFHIQAVAPGIFREEEIHLIDRATSWAPGGRV